MPNELLGANKRDVSREQHSDVPARESGPRLRVRASDRRVDALLKADEVQDDWKQSVRNAISQGIITAQTRLVLQVEYCTAERPSETLRGSKEQYSKNVETVRASGARVEFAIRLPGRDARRPLRRDVEAGNVDEARDRTPHARRRRSARLRGEDRAALPESQGLPELNTRLDYAA